MSRHARIRPLALAALGLLLGACTKGRPFELGEAACASWPDAAPVLATRCVSCHGPDKAELGYRLDSYRGAVEVRPDGSQRVNPGGADSLLLVAAKGTLAGHPGTGITAAELATLSSWIVDCRVSVTPSRIHERGWLNPGDTAQFHGLALRQTGYLFAPCTQCHGASLEGGPSGVSCASCHPSGLLTCGTCHGDATSPAPPRDLTLHSLASFAGVGAHRTHAADGPLHQAYPCGSCHSPVPAQAEDPGHYRLGFRALLPPVTPVLSSGEGQTASYDPATHTCSGVQCHSPRVDSAASNQQPVWTRVGTGEAACGACHGIPPGAPHSPDSRCQVCHRKAYVKGLLDKTMHANGTVEVNYGCSGCHGGGDNAAPPLDLSGNTDESLPTVGAHQAHLRAFDGFSAPVACSECHQVPARFDDPGHVDHLPPATVFPDAAGVGTLARKAGAAPVYDPATGTCSSVYCHGNGLTFTGDLSPGLIRSPSWTGGASQIVCGSCHGIPPTGHKAGTTLFACARCHRQTIDATGAIVVKTDAASGARSSTHIDGNLTLGSSP